MVSRKATARKRRFLPIYAFDRTAQEVVKLTPEEIKEFNEPELRRRQTLAENKPKIKKFLENNIQNHEKEIAKYLSSNHEKGEIWARKIIRDSVIAADLKMPLPKVQKRNESLFQSQKTSAPELFLQLNEIKAFYNKAQQMSPLYQQTRFMASSLSASIHAYEKNLKQFKQKPSPQLFNLLILNRNALNDKIVRLQEELKIL